MSGAALMALLTVAGGFRPADKRGETKTVTIATSLLPDKKMNVNITVPGDYAEGNEARYPVIYLLNGHGGNNTSWGSVANLDSLASAHEVIFVCPDGMNSWYFDAPERPDMKMESFIIDELLPWVDANYRTIPRRESRAITGLSMGGHGAMWLAMRHKDKFANAGSTSGGVDFTPFPGSWNISKALGERDSFPERWRNSTVISQVPGLKSGELNLIVDCGTEDFFYTVNCQLDSALNANHLPHIYRTSPGAHTGQYWAKSIIPQVEYFSSVLVRE